MTALQLRAELRCRLHNIVAFDLAFVEPEVLAAKPRHHEWIAHGIAGGFELLGVADEARDRVVHSDLKGPIGIDEEPN